MSRRNLIDAFLKKILISNEDVDRDCLVIESLHSDGIVNDESVLLLYSILNADTAQ